MVQQKTLKIGSSSRLFSLIDPDAQPKGANPCVDQKCDHLCLVVPDGAACKCDADYKLGDDKKSCKRANVIQTVIIAVIAAILCGFAIGYSFHLLSRKKL